MNNFQDLLKKIRNKADLTQEDLAKALGVSTVLISMIETGQKQVSRNFIENLAEKLSVHPSSITPFSFIEKDMDIKKLSALERNLIKAGSKFQDYLITTKAKKLREYV